jgi:hypothetical protein
VTLEVDLSPQGCTVVVRVNGQYGLLLDPSREEVLRCAERPTPWPASGPVVETLDELRDYVWRQIYQTYLAPIFALALALVPVSPRLIWSSAAEWVGVVSRGRGVPRRGRRSVSGRPARHPRRPDPTWRT